METARPDALSDFQSELLAKSAVEKLRRRKPPQHPEKFGLSSGRIAESRGAARECFQDHSSYRGGVIAVSQVFADGVKRARA